MARLTRGSSGEGALTAHARTRPFGRLAALLTAASIGAATLAAPSAARADESSGKGKGIAGGALLGGELVIAVEAAAGVEKPWAYAVGGVLGAGAGAVGGYFVEQNAEPRIPLYMLAGGMALIIPAAILALNATSYKPPPAYEEDAARPDNEPVAEPPQGSPAVAPPPSAPATPPPATGPGSEAPKAKPARAARLVFRTRLPMPVAAPPSTMLQLSDSGLRLGVPAVAVVPTYSRTEMQQFGVQQREEVRIPVIGAVF